MLTYIINAKVSLFIRYAYTPRLLNRSLWNFALHDTLSGIQKRIKIPFILKECDPKHGPVVVNPYFLKNKFANPNLYMQFLALSLYLPLSSYLTHSDKLQDIPKYIRNHNYFAVHWISLQFSETAIYNKSLLIFWHLISI